MGRLRTIRVLAEMSYWILLSLVAFITILQVITGYWKRLEVVTDGGPWEAQQIVVKKINELEAKDVNTITTKDANTPKAKEENTITAETVNKITAKDINDMHSMYIVNIHNKGEVTKKTYMKMPAALYWEVSWSGIGRTERRNYAKTELIPLPDILKGMDVNVIIWSPRDATRAIAKEISVQSTKANVTKLIIRPARKSILLLNQHIYIVLTCLLASPAIIKITKKIFKLKATKVGSTAQKQNKKK